MDREVICMPFILTENRIAYVQEGQLLAEATFPEFAPGVVNIDHTFVDEALRGQGVAAQMMERIARSLRETGRKAIPTCSYAKKWFGQHPEYADVLIFPAGTVLVVPDVETSTMAGNLPPWMTE